jgi:hypothetical protein
LESRDLPSSIASLLRLLEVASTGGKTMSQASEEASIKEYPANKEIIPDYPIRQPLLWVSRSIEPFDYQACTARIEGAPVLPSITFIFKTASIFRFEKSFPT